jgi:valine dehydrogenase (NAD+)
MTEGNPMATTVPPQPLLFEHVDELATAAHEQVIFCHDEPTGLRAIIGIHSTKLGPSLGGTRFTAYPSVSAALRDVLRLAEGMTYKAAAAGLPLGGGKAVIIGDPATVKTPELLAAYGRFVDRLGGAYVTAADVGTTAVDLDVINTVTRHVVGTTRGSGDSGRSTAIGVYEAMRAAAEVVWGQASLEGRRVGVEGVGKVGAHLVDLLVTDGAHVVVTDPSDVAVNRVVQAHETRVQALDSVADAAVDVYAPCALGATLDTASLDRLQARVVCGAANNQLASAEVDVSLQARGVVWVPDFVANAGGLIQVGGELLGRDDVRMRHDIQRIGLVTRELLTRALAAGAPTGQVAATLAHEHLAGATDSS